MSTVATLALCAGVLFGAGSAVYASDSVGGAIPADSPNGAVIAELSVQNVWLEGDSTLHIQVADTRTGVNQTLELNLRDYAGVSDEFVSIQAVDRDGNKSNTIQFKNPFYVVSANAEPGEGAAGVTSGDTSGGAAQTEPIADNGGIPGGGDSNGGAANVAKPFTPDGAGSVVDNATDGDGKEFFSIRTEDGNVFYLIVDRQRTADNVYLLNAVTENDLASLAKPGDGMGGGIPTIAPVNTGEQPANAAASANGEPTAPAPSAPPAKTNGGINGGAIIFIVIAALAVGGAGYYFKILKPKRAADDSEEYDETEDEAEYDDYDGDSDEDDEEGDGDDEDADDGDADADEDEGTGGDSE